MNKIILSLLLSFIAFSGITVFADQENSGPERKMNLELEKKLFELKERERNRVGEIASSTDQRQRLIYGKNDDLRPGTQQKIEKKYEKIATKYLRAIEREETIMTKITSRIEKIKALGGNTTEAEKLITEAKNSLTQARTAYETMKSTAISADSVEKITKETLASLKTTAKNIEKYLKDAHRTLQKTIGSLKGISQLKNATSTREN